MAWLESYETKHGTRYRVRTRTNGKNKNYKAGHVHQFAVKLRNKLEERDTENIHFPDTHTVQDLYADYLQISAKTKRPSTISHIKDHLKPFLAQYGTYKIKDIKKVTVEGYKNHLLLSGYAVNGVNIKLIALRAMFEYAVRIGWSEKNLAKEVAKEEAQETYRTLTDDEVDRLLTIGCRFNKELREIIRVFLYTGMREGELVNLKREQIQDGCILIERVRSKSKKMKVIPIHPDILPVFERAKSGPVFPLWTANRVRQTFRRAIIRAKIIGRVRIHDLRHTTASWLLRKGILNLEEVSKFLGHTNIKTTQIYSHFETSYLKNKIKTFKIPA